MSTEWEDFAPEPQCLGALRFELASSNINQNRDCILLFKHIVQCEKKFNFFIT